MLFRLRDVGYCGALPMSVMVWPAERILWAMWDSLSQAQNSLNQPVLSVKCLQYHPHGDSSVYEAMVRMAGFFAIPACERAGNWISTGTGKRQIYRGKISKIAEETYGYRKETVDCLEL